MKINNISLVIFPAVMAMGSFQPVQANEADAQADHHGITILAEDYALEAPDEIPSGWTRIVYENGGEEPHFMTVARLPDGVSFDDLAVEVVAPFNEAWYALRDDGAGQEEVMAELGAKLPEWFADYRFKGGSGIIDPGGSNTITLDLEPGNYVLECYFKTEDGEMHSIEGMIRPITVSEERSATVEPEPDVTVTLSNFTMEIEGALTPGRHTVAVHVKENPEVGFGHNVHVARLEPDTDVDELIRWMDFFEVDGMRVPSQAEFFGGMHLLEAGETGYFTLDIEPGEYLFVSEYTGDQGVRQRVSVAP